MDTLQDGFKDIENDRAEFLAEKELKKYLLS